jgi:hypothetical protein
MKFLGKNRIMGYIFPVRQIRGRTRRDEKGMERVSSNRPAWKSLRRDEGGRNFYLHRA